MYILGISAFYHDSAAAILKDGIVIAAAQEERFTRKKHDSSFPTNAVKYCLNHAGISIDDLEAVVFYDKPFIKFERLLETYYAYAPKGIRSFIAAMPIWLTEKLFLKKLLRDELKEIEDYDKKKLKLQFTEHHLSHAASTFFASNLKESAILTIDGVGEWATASICVGRDNQITILKELHFPHSLGLLYSAFTYYLGFKVNSGEYKLMGLAPYGNPKSEQVAHFKNLIVSELVEIKDDGSIWVNQTYFDYTVGLRMANDKKWEKLFGLKRREKEDEPLSQDYCNLALAIQLVTEEVVMKMAEHAKALTGMDNICLSGGVALNCVANGVLIRSNLFDKVYIQPAAGDAGGALGAAYASYYIHQGKPRYYGESTDNIEHTYLGPEFDKTDIEKTLNAYKAAYTKFENGEGLYTEVAGHLANGLVVGWFQGRMEWGPRALGNRSILADPRNKEMQKKLNLKIKYREGFRPFAPSVMAEDANEYFEMNSDSPYMLLTTPVNQSIRNTLPEGFDDYELNEKLYFERSNLPAITHIDFSARVQTVTEESNSRYYNLLQAFKTKSGTGMLVNTSFNVRGEPIVCTPSDAYRCFMNTEMDVLVVGDYVMKKDEQPHWEKLHKFDLD